MLRKRQRAAPRGAAPSLGAVALSKKFSRPRPTSAHKVFVARIDRFLSYWQSHGEAEPAFLNDIAPQRESLLTLFQRLRSDERMQPTWGALAALFRGNSGSRRATA